MYSGWLFPNSISSPYLSVELTENIQVLLSKPHHVWISQKTPARADMEMPTIISLITQRPFTPPSNPICSRLKPSQTLSICLTRVSHHVSPCVTDTCLFQAWAHSPSTVSVRSCWHSPHQHPNCHPAHWHSSQPKGFVTHRANTLLHCTAKIIWQKQVTAMGVSSGQPLRPIK